MMQKSWHNLPNLRLCWLIILIISFELYRFLEREMSKIRLFEMEFHVFFHRSYLVKSDNLWSNWIHQKVFHANLRSLKNINFLQNIFSRIFLCCFLIKRKKKTFDVTYLSHESLIIFWIICFVCWYALFISGLWIRDIRFTLWYNIFCGCWLRLSGYRAWPISSLHIFWLRWIPVTIILSWIIWRRIKNNNKINKRQTHTLNSNARLSIMYWKIAFDVSSSNHLPSL